MAKIPKKAKIRTINRMVREIDAQLKGVPATETSGDGVAYILDDFTDEQLQKVRDFMLSFIPMALRNEAAIIRGES